MIQIALTLLTALTVHASDRDVRCAIQATNRMNPTAPISTRLPLHHIRGYGNYFVVRDMSALFGKMKGCQSFNVSRTWNLMGRYCGTSRPFSPVEQDLGCLTKAISASRGR